MNGTLSRYTTEIADYFEEKAMLLTTQLLACCKDVKKEKAEEMLQEVLGYCRLQHNAETVKDAVSSEAEGEPVYYISTIFLKDAYKDLMKCEVEDLRFATGVAVDQGVYVPTKLLHFKMKLNSEARAEADQESMAQLLIWLSQQGHKLCVTLHSHPGAVADCVFPSPTDKDYHRRLEAGNYPVIGVIFSRGGHFRFFSNEREFEVVLTGTGVEEIDHEDRIYRFI